MALEDKDIFLAICNRYGDQPIEFIMEQYEKAKRLNLQIEKRIGESSNQPPVEEAAPAQPEAAPEAEQEQPRKKFTKRDLVVKPLTAITDESVTCCLCGAKRQSLTSTHLLTHGITVPEYKKLCGYTPEQKLMSGRKLAKAKEVIKHAQQVRLEKKALQEED